MITILPLIFVILLCVSVYHYKNQLAIFSAIAFAASMITLFALIDVYRVKLPTKNTMIIYDQYTGKPSITRLELDTPWWLSPVSIYVNKEIK